VAPVETSPFRLRAARLKRALHCVSKIAPDRLHERRLTAISVECSQGSVNLRDQLKLQQGHVELMGGWSWSDLIAALNSRVFFWPGDHDGPNDYGRRLFDAYDLAEQTVLRVGLGDLLEANPDTSPYFCRFNSGAPRTVNGRKSPRGPDTFLAGGAWPHSPSEVVEISFVCSVSLPRTTEVWNGARWGPL
jgi:hypothetical protein